MYAGSRRRFGDDFGSEYPYEPKKKRTWDTSYASLASAVASLPAPPPFPYGSSQTSSDLTALYDQDVGNYDSLWDTGYQHNDDAAAVTSGGVEWGSSAGVTIWDQEETGTQNWTGTSSGYMDAYSDYSAGGYSAGSYSAPKKMGSKRGMGSFSRGYGASSGGVGGTKRGMGTRGRGSGRGAVRGVKKSSTFASDSWGDSSNFVDDFALINAAEQEYLQQGTVDFNKIKKALLMATQQSGQGQQGRGRGRSNFQNERPWQQQSFSTHDFGHGRGAQRGRGKSPGQRGGGRDMKGGPSRGRGAFAKTTPYDKVQGFGVSRGRGRGKSGVNKGQGFGGYEPVYTGPIHSMARVSVPDPSTMSPVEKIRRFALFIQRDSQKVNDIQTVENGLTGSKLGLQADYAVEELVKVSRRIMYTGRLFIGGYFLARTVGASKKEVKHDCYKKAVEVLKTKSVHEIVKMDDVGTDVMREELLASMKDSESVNPVLDAQKTISNLEQNLATQTTVEEAPLIQGFNILIKYLKSGKCEQCPNAISELSQAFTASFCKLQHHYHDTSTRLSNGFLTFVGKLTINDILVGSASNNKKKDAKMKTYEQALDFLKKRHISVIVQGIKCDDVPPEETEKEDPSTLPNEKTYKKLCSLIPKLPTFNGLDTVVNGLDVTTHQLHLVPTCLYRKNVVDTITEITCELYLDNILISSAVAAKTKDAQCQTYAKALEVLKANTPDVIFNTFTRLSKDDLVAPNVDVWVKGKSRASQSNLERLKKSGFDPFTNEKGPKDIVLIERQEWAFDRKRQAFAILNLSASLNNLLLEWKVTPVGTFFKCQMFLQLKQVGEACAPSKNVARNLAAADALFKLYETQATISIIPKDDSQFWVTFASAKEKGDKKKAEAGDTGTDDMIPISLPDATEKTAEEEAADHIEDNVAAEKPMINKWVKLVLEEMLQEFSKQETAEDIVFAPCLPFGERRLIRITARDLGLKYTFKPTKENSTCSVMKRNTPQQLLKILKMNGGSASRYVVMTKEQLPKHDDIKDQLNTNIGKIITQPVAVKKEQSLIQSFETTGEYETANSTLFESSQMSAKKLQVKSPFGGFSDGNASFQTSTPRGAFPRKRGRGRGNTFVSGNVKTQASFVGADFGQDQYAGDPSDYQMDYFPS